MVKPSKAGPFDYIRFILSGILLLFSAVLTFYLIVEQKTIFWKQVPGWAGVLIFLGVLFWLGVVEGILISIVEVKRLDPEEYRETYPLSLIHI